MGLHSVIKNAHYMGSNIHLAPEVNNFVDTIEGNYPYELRSYRELPLECDSHLILLEFSFIQKKDWGNAPQSQKWLGMSDSIFGDYLEFWRQNKDLPFQSNCGIEAYFDNRILIITLVRG